MNITIEEGVVKHTQRSVIRKYSDSTKKDLLSETILEAVVVFKDKDGTVYPDGKIIKSDEYATIFTYDYNKDKYGDIISCQVSKTKKKNDKSLDFEKTKIIYTYNKKGKLVKEEHFTRDDLAYVTNTFLYNDDGEIVSQKSKGTHTVLEKKFYHGQIRSITETTIKSKIVNRSYEAFFDKNDRVYKVYDYDKHIETDYERDFDGDGNVLSETQRFFDISTTNKKLISYIVTTYNPAAGYKIATIIKNGILTEKHQYNLKGEELSMYYIEDGKELFKRTEKTIDIDTGNIIITTTITITDQNTGHDIKNEIIKETYDKNNNLLVYANNDSIVTEYEYDENNRRTSAITKKLIDEKFVIINEVLYTYEEDEETNSTTKIRQLTVFNKDGEIVSKDIHKEIFDETTETYKEDKMLFDVETSCNCK